MSLWTSSSIAFPVLLLEFSRKSRALMIHLNIDIYMSTLHQNFLVWLRLFFAVFATMHDFKSLQLDDEDSSMYFINYITEDSDSVENTHENISNPSPEESDQSESNSVPNSLIITPVPQELFTNQQWKVSDLPSFTWKSHQSFVFFSQDEFEQLFRVYDSEIIVLYLKFFQRIRITFTTSSQALQARLNLHEYSFHGTTIKTYFACVSQSLLIFNPLHCFL